MAGKTPGLSAMIHSTLIKIDEGIHVQQNLAAKINKERIDRGEPSPGVTEHTLQTPDMHHEMIPLLLARSNCLLALAMDAK